MKERESLDLFKEIKKQQLMKDVGMYEETHSFGSLTEVEKSDVLNVIVDGIGFVEWCKERNEPSSTNPLGIPDSILSCVRWGFQDHLRITKDSVFYYPYPGRWFNHIAVLLALGEYYGFTVKFSPPQNSSYGHGTWQIELQSLSIEQEGSD